jgi:hypothetical protein
LACQVILFNKQLILRIFLMNFYVAAAQQASELSRKKRFRDASLATPTYNKANTRLSTGVPRRDSITFRS